MPDNFDVYQGLGARAAQGLAGRGSAFGGVQNIGDVRSQYDIGDSSGVFGPLKQYLASQQAKAMQGAQLRAGRSANPEMGFSTIQAGGLDALSQLLGKQGEADVGLKQLAAQFLQGARGAQDQYALNQAGTVGNLSQGLASGALQKRQVDYATQGPSFWDIASTILGQGAKVAGAALTPGASSIFNFGQSEPTTSGGGGSRGAR